MSRTIELLKKRPPKEGAMHEHIAKTYFHHKPRLKDTINRKTIFAVSFSVIFLFLLVPAFLYIRNHPLKFLQQNRLYSKEIKIFDEGTLNKKLIKQFEFRGYGKNDSKILEDFIVLHNPKKYYWADFTLDFGFPIDFSKRSLSLVIKSKVGGEKMAIVLRDINNKSCRMNDIYFTSDWKTQSISFDKVKEGIDLSRITHLRFEYGYPGESSETQGSSYELTLYIKKIYLLKGA